MHEVHDDRDEKISTGRFLLDRVGDERHQRGEEVLWQSLRRKANEMPTGPDQPPYIMMQINGKNVCAMYENKKVPTKWLSYVSVANVDESAKKAKSLGGKLKTEPFDVMDVGRMANVLDSQ